MATGSDALTLEQYALRREVGTWEGLYKGLFRFIRTKPLGAFGGTIVVILLLMALFPAVFATHNPNPTPPPILDRLQGPSWSHWMGTDQQGRDVYSRIVFGARTSIVIGFLVVTISAMVASLIGTMSGYFGGWIDTIAQRFVDIGIALPGLIFIILVVTSLQERAKDFLEPMGFSPENAVVLLVALSLGILVSLGSSRVIRGAAISAKQNVYVEAARVVGATDARIMVRHIFPNVFAPIRALANRSTM